MQIAITYRGLIADRAELQRLLGAKYQTFLNKLTVRTKQKVGPDKVAQVYKLINIDGIDAILLPRMIMPALKSSGVARGFVNMIAPPQGWVAAAPPFICELFPNQRVVIDHLFSNIFTDERAAAGTAACVINLRAGQGKTFVAAAVINRLRCRALYIAANIDLQKQAVNDLRSSFDGALIARTDGSRICTKDKKTMTFETAHVVVMVIDSVKNMPDEFFERFGLVIFDEIQMYCGATRSNVFWRAQTRYVLGMSATTANRVDKFDEIYYKHLGAPIMTDLLPGFDIEEFEFKGLVHKIMYKGPPEHTRALLSEATGFLSVTDMYKQFAADPQRNELIVDEIMKLLRKGRNIFVFSESRHHLDILYALLIAKVDSDDIEIEAPDENKQEDVPNDATSISLMRGGIKDKDRTTARAARIILTTYSYSSTGTSIPRMDAAVFATPRRNGYIQICARVMRKSGDATILREFVDIVDAATGLKSQYYGRAAAYDFYQFEIKPRVVNAR
jgi:superfamily II DNA or RNA helicase